MRDSVLVINLDSSSLKAALVDSTGVAIWNGNRKRGPDESVREVLDQWLAPELEQHRQQIMLIGHRVVHGGDRFTAPTLITAELEEELETLIPLAPLHNPPALAGLTWARRWAPQLPQ